MNNHPDYFICVTTLCRRCLLTKHGEFVCLQCLLWTRPALDTEFSTHVKFNGRRPNKVTKQNNLHFISDPPIFIFQHVLFCFRLFFGQTISVIFIITRTNAKLNGEKANNPATKNDFYFLSDKSVSNFKCLFLWIFFAVRFFFESNM